MRSRLTPIFCFLLPWMSLSALAQGARLTVDANQAIAPVSPTLYGLMTEEINHAYDGGLYAELIANRTFRHEWDGYDHWTLVAHGSAQVALSQSASGPSEALPHGLQLTISNAAAGFDGGIANIGYWGVAVRPQTTYAGSFYASGDGINAARVELVSNATGAVLAEATVPLSGVAWKQYRFDLKTAGNIPAQSESHFELTFRGNGSVALQLVSLFPPTFHNRPNGNRPDLMELMAGMNPKFLRLPGGNYLEGDTIPERFEWKKTIGPLKDRPTHRGPWQYQSSDGLGLLEFLEWCEDLKIKPVLAVYAGYSLRGDHVTGSALEPYIQDALDEIEYVTGSTATKWGAVRASDGHPAPFPLEYVEIGNEDEFDKSGSYDERFAAFASAIRQHYPQYKLIATTPVKGSTPDVIDDHYYKTAEEFYAQAHKYDSYDRSGPKIFVGEWATRSGSPTPTFGDALGDAAWMTSMERNSDLIVMASYAPLLTNMNPGGMQWFTDLIGYDGFHSFGSPSYYAQVLFASHLGDHTVKTEGEGLNPRFFWSATTSAEEKVLHLKLVNASDKPQTLHLLLEGIEAGQASVTTLHAPSTFAVNSLTEPKAVHPMTATVSAQQDWSYEVPGDTIQVIDVPLK